MHLSLIKKKKQKNYALNAFYIPNEFISPELKKRDQQILIYHTKHLKCDFFTVMLFVVITSMVYLLFCLHGVESTSIN